jgi:methylthioribose-1-phosphate isomerase
MKNKKNVSTLFWEGGELHLLDQRFLPHRVVYRICSSCQDVVDSICEMSVRGAPAIGISAAFGMAIAARKALEKGLNVPQMRSDLEEADRLLRCSRPTAVNLAWALDRVDKWLGEHQNASPGEIFSGIESEAIQIFTEDVENNRRIGLNGQQLIPEKASILTHCNAGALATGGYGTALGVIRASMEAGKDVHVYVDETRPLLQGSRITAFELVDEGIPATLVTDNCAGYLMSLGKIDLVITGADRIAINGDSANKIGTYSLAVLANHHRIPFYIAAPLSTIDRNISSGKGIIIEERSQDEVTHLNGENLAPPGITALNPAFDITPAALISAIITEHGVVCAPDREKLLKLF